MLTCKSKMAGSFRCVVRKASGVVVKDTGWFRNLITNTGLNFIAKNEGYLNACAVGSGSSTPQATDTQLENQVATQDRTSTDSFGVSGVAPHYAYMRTKFEFGVGAAAGNLSEIGLISNDSFPSNGEFFCRALIKDSGGNPTTITVLADEILTVLYEFRVYAYDGADVVDVVDINGTPTTVTIRPCEVDRFDFTGLAMHISSNGDSQDLAQAIAAYTGDIQAITAIPSGTGAGAGVNVTAPYVPDSFQLVYPIVFSPGVANFGGGIGAVALRTGSVSWQIGFSPKIPKTANDEFKFNFTYAWANA